VQPLLTQSQRDKARRNKTRNINHLTRVWRALTLSPYRLGYA
jgi:hypothetical protein